MRKKIKLIGLWLSNLWKKRSLCLIRVNFIGPTNKKKSNQQQKKKKNSTTLIFVSMQNRSRRQLTKNQKKDLNLRCQRPGLNLSTSQWQLPICQKWKISTIGTETFIPKKYRKQHISLKQFNILAMMKRKWELFSLYILRAILLPWNIWTIWIKSWGRRKRS